MPNKLPVPPPGFDDLSVEDQIGFVQSLWDRIAANAEQVPVPDWHREILNERLHSDAAGDKSWEEVRSAIRAKLDDA